jgi:hypothetical protein
VRLSESFGPLYFTRVSLQFKVFVALGATEAKELAVVSGELNAMARVDR